MPRFFCNYIIVTKYSVFLILSRHFHHKKAAIMTAFLRYRSSSLYRLLFPILLIRYNLTPFIFRFFPRHFHGNMGKPTVLFCPVPMLYIRGNRDNHPRDKADGLFSFFLIPSLACGTNQNLSAALFRVMDVPVIPAARLKSYIGKEYRAFSKFGKRV